jgi:hypothetical protein
VRYVALALVVVFAAGCGGAVSHGNRHTGNARTLSAFGVTIDLPIGWSGRILLGAEGRPVVHAASFPLPSNDTDEGEVAKESMGRDVYLNIRDLGPGDSAVAFPFTFAASEFGPPPPGATVCCRILQTSKDASFDGELYRVTAVSGGEARPSDAELEQLNDAVLSLQVALNKPATVEPATGQAISGYGIHAELPSGWTGSVGRGTVQATDGSLELQIREHGGSDAASFVTGRIPIRLGPAEFVPVGGVSGFETGRSFIDNGRDFVLGARSTENPPSPASLDGANELLASFRVEAGDFYPGTVKPATFASADGWNVGTSGPADEQADGQQTWTWASTVSYLDEPQQFPPSKTLEHLPPDGIVVDVMLYGPTDHAGTAEPPFRIAQAEREYPWEGQIGEIPLYAIGGRVSGQPYEVQISVLFGRNQPTEDQIVRADAELARLKLPDWATN